MAYKNLYNEQASKLAQTLGPEFTAAAKNDLINFADAILGLAERADAPFVPEEFPKEATVNVAAQKVKPGKFINSADKEAK